MSVNISEIFGENVFSMSVMRERLPKAAYAEMLDVMEHGGNISMATADIVANAMKDWALEKIPVTLLEDFPKKSPKPRLLRGKLELSGGVVGMYITGEQGNGILHTMVGCNVLALVPAGSGALAKGTVLEGYWMDGKNGGAL